MQLRARTRPDPAETAACIASYVNLPPLDPSEESHRVDFVLADKVNPGRARSVILAGLVRFFQGVLLIFAPTAPAISLAYVAPPRRSERALRDMTQLFDKLAGYYADKYRGSVILIYGLGLLAVLMALSATILPWPDRWPNAEPRVFLAIEFGLLMVVLLVHVRGRSARPGLPTGSPRRHRTHRWHERWLDYRALAERFRYAELHMAMRREGETIAVSSADDWCTRHFQQELAHAGTQRLNVEDHAWFLHFAIDEQQRYHHQNAHVCHVLSHRLHWLTIVCFFLAVAAVVIEFASAWCDERLLSYRHWIICFEYQAHFWLYATAGLPALAAALHGIQSACEWSKLARNSTAIERALAELRTKLEAWMKCRHGDDAGEQEALNSITARFLQLTTEDLTGWRATFCDKNVPLAV